MQIILKNTSNGKCLELLKKLKKLLQQDDSWPALEQEVGELIAAIEIELQKISASPKKRNADLEKLFMRAAWVIRILFGLSDD